LEVINHRRNEFVRDVCFVIWRYLIESIKVCGDSNFRVKRGKHTGGRESRKVLREIESENGVIWVMKRRLGLGSEGKGEDKEK